jgi:hypothetical protein
VARETFIRGQDIATQEIIDSHINPSSNLAKMIAKKVLDTVFVQNVSITPLATSIRIDNLLLDQPQGVGAVDLGILTDRYHEVFQAGTEKAVMDAIGEKVIVQLSFGLALTFSVNLTTGLAIGVTVGNPGDVQIGDWVRVQGQGLVGDYFTKVLNKVPAGPNFQLTLQDVFAQGPTGLYTMQRINRWTANFLDSALAPFAMPGTPVDFGFFKRVYLADVSETIGVSPINKPELTPEQVVSAELPAGGMDWEPILRDSAAPNDVRWADDTWQHAPNRKVAVYRLRYNAGTDFISNQGNIPAFYGSTATNIQDATGAYLRRNSQNNALGAAAGIIDTGLNNGTPTSSVGSQFRHRPVLHLNMKTGAVITNCRIWVLLTDSIISDGDGDTPVGNYIGFRYSTTADGTAFWRTISSDGSGSATVKTTTVAITADTNYLLSIDASDPTAVKFYINKQLVATHSIADLLPGSTAYLSYEAIVITLELATKQICLANMVLASD